MTVIDCERPLDILNPKLMIMILIAIKTFACYRLPFSIMINRVPLNPPLWPTAIPSVCQYFLIAPRELLHACI